MKNRFFMLSASAAAMLLAGCQTSTTIYDPATTTLNIRQEGAVSSEEMRQIAVAAVKGAMTNPRFSKFLAKFNAENPNEVPVLKLDKVINDTDDPDLNVDELTDMLNTELINHGVVDVTMAEGAGRSQAIAASRDLENDENFDQKTVVKRGTLQAARLVLRPKVISNTVRDGDKKVVVRTFVMDMADIKTGLIMWKFTKQLGFMKEKGTFGW